MCFSPLIISNCPESILGSIAALTSSTLWSNDLPFALTTLIVIIGLIPVVPGPTIAISGASSMVF